MLWEDCNLLLTICYLLCYLLSYTFGVNLSITCKPCLLLLDVLRPAICFCKNQFWQKICIILSFIIFGFPQTTIPNWDRKSALINEQKLVLKLLKVVKVYRVSTNTLETFSASKAPRINILVIFEMPMTFWFKKCH